MANMIDYLAWRGDLPVEKIPLGEADLLVLSRLADNLRTACRDAAPNVICAYIYELAVAANKFYHDVKIISEPDAKKRESYIALIELTRRTLETCIDLLGFSAPEKM